MSNKRISAITGGANGIGLATAQQLAAAGDVVVLLDVADDKGAAEAEALRAAGRQAHYLHFDVREGDQVSEVAARVEAEVGPVELLVNSAGLLQNAITSWAVDLAEHDAIWQVNYRGTYLSCRAFGAAMRQRRRGAMVNLASINSFAVLPLPAYNPSKAAVKQLTELLAVEYGPYGVRVNAVAPTYTLTENLKARIDAGLRDGEQIKRSGALAMFVLPQHIADAIQFLASEKAAAITGVTLPVDAGWLAAVGAKSYPADVEGAD